MRTAEELFEVPPALPAAPAPAAPLPRRRDRWRDAINATVAYLPVLLMALLAAATWWLVRATPVPEPERPSGPPRGEPDYTMEHFVVQRFDRDGALRARIEGDRMRHFPNEDELRVDNARILTTAEDGRVTVASARQAISNGDGSELRLEGDARVRREPHAGEPAIEFRGERLAASRHARTVVADAPVTVTQGQAVLRADRLRYDHATRQLELIGRVRVTLP
ncbi:MAG: LPS export ABC transporter periplasmic protein LptC [Ideonella sp.]|nr:LPS export ABC transporter periplasmic protein LptC [Ideonella sp.]